MKTLIALLTLAVAALLCVAVRPATSANAQAIAGPTQATAAEDSDPVVTTARTAIAATVRITTCKNDDPSCTMCVQSRGRNNYSGVGSGVVYRIDGTTAYAVTNTHVIVNAARTFVALTDPVAGEFLDDGIEAKVVGSDPLTEVAVISFSLEGVPNPPVPAVVADPKDLRVGQRTVAVGNPLDLGLTASSGIISKLGRRTQLGLRISHLIQTDTPLNPGNSGGGLWSLNGRFAGVNVAILGKNNMGLGFAIPAQFAVASAERMRTSPGGRITHGAIGVRLDMNHRGIFIEVVAPWTDNRLAVGDQLLKVDGHDVASLEEAARLIDQAPPGNTLDLVVRRNGRTLTLSKVFVKEMTEPGPLN